MTRLLSGSTLRSGGSGDFLKLEDAMPQLPATDTTLTGFTIATDSVLRTTYRSSLGFVEFTTASMYSALPEGTIRVLSTGATFLSTTTQTGNLVVQGGIGVGGNMTIEYDIVVNGVTVGRGWEGQNNIVLRGVAETPLNDFNNGQSSIAIGDSSLLGLDTANRVIAIGRYALTSGTSVSDSIAIGDNALKNIGAIDSHFAGNIVSASVANPVVLEVIGHGLTTGTQVVVNDATGMLNLNQSYYWINVLTPNTFALYTDNILSQPLDGNLFSPYTGGGRVGRTLYRSNNIAIGSRAAEKLIDGKKNFFFGDLIAKNLTTGSDNIFIGSDVAGNMTEASGIISIGSDNLVDGRDNQVAIGSVIYYDGTSTTNINANTEVGIGTQSTSTNTGGLRVIGGAGIQRNLVVGEELYVTSSTFFTGDVLPATTTTNLGSATNPFNALFLKGSTLYLSTVTLKSANSLDFKVESPAGFVRQTVGNLTLNSGLASTGINDGSLIVAGGAAVQGDLNVGGQFNVEGVEDVTLSPNGADVYIQPTAGGTLLIQPNAAGTMDNVAIGGSQAAAGTFTTLKANSTTASTSTTTGALTVSGGVGIRGDVYAGSGNPAENYMLYTPRSTISTSPPVGARLGDFWINPTGPYFLQYILDGTNKIWIQIGSA
jgi:hypothetical protein